MKTTKTFKNATLRTVNDGYIELDYNDETHCFSSASVVSVNNGNISIEVDWKPKKGELIKAIGCGIDCYVIFNYISNSKISTSPNILYTYGSVKIDSALYKYFNLDNTTWAFNHNLQLLPVTPEEIQELNDQLASEGKYWNPDTMQIERLKWKPIEGTKYFYIVISGGLVRINSCIWMNDIADEKLENYYEIGNCFKTKEEAIVKLEQIKKLLLEV